MVSIYVNGKDSAEQISDWTMKSDGHGEFVLTCRDLSGERVPYSLGDCEVVPTRELKDQLLRKKGSSVTSPIEKAAIYGEKYAVVQYSGSTARYLFKMDTIELVTPTKMKDEPTYNYFLSVANSRVEQAVKPADKVIAENVLRQLSAIPSCADTALHAYCTGKNAQQEQTGHFIFPFGINESQLQAVEQAFTSQISLIEGPPGTGKTQTILNIVANILLRGKNVAVVSNNNSAVANVCEKLGKSGLDYLVASLGSTENREAFFANPRPRPSAVPEAAPSMERIQVVLQQLKGFLSARNAVAQLQIEIDELEVERRYLQQWQQDNGVQIPALDKYKLSPQKSADLMAYLTHMAGGRVRIRDRIEMLFNFRILRMKPFDNWEKRKSTFYALQLHYYDKVLQEKQVALTSHQQALRLGSYQVLLEELTSASMKYLKQHLHQHVPNPEPFDAKTYKRKLDGFLKRYPIISSSTHSIINSLESGAMLDYVIIDEASQQDIVPGILALGCAKNLIIVGDRKQLAHIPAKLGMAAPKDHYDCEKHSLLDSCVSVFNGSIPTTLLKEHYRCHPRIIQFCNQQFYDNQLVPMTKDSGEKPLSLLVTAKGNHTRKTTNLRELDSLLAILEGEGESVWEGEDGRGFIAPFRAQATLSGTVLPADFVNDTVHKFQGRECDEIVFSTVLDKKSTTPKFLTFVDDPRMVNVAVSRAKHRFTLVTGDDVFTKNNGHIAALVRYIEYYAEDRQLHRAPVISAFDLLYKEYDQSLERLNARLRRDESRYRSEQIVAQILREALDQDACRGITFHSQIALIQLVSTTCAGLTTRELEFMRNHASCDFVLYYKVGKKPLGVIEVDGGEHDKPEQAERDALKDSILRKCDIPLLRLRTVESRIEERVAAFLSQWASNVSN
ncbi:MULTISPECIES: AAA domain-containing protein [unclassified Pseudomonas]|uniref:AAA domain-containing protein n=1 Tax=unclassified Pseudomonas TaxID=196821 RepID=UPI000CD06088|nr:MULTISPECIES: AAA domain-containing protein [unclassified Pseudomonas]POA28249.1 helicase [Pseudomonas sp. GW456-R21]POA63638.1 helicase [Pseudomonas sp. GW460-R15]